MIELRGVSKTVPSGGGSLTILHPLDLTIDAGRVIAITGPSGSGKSTLLGLLAGLDAPSSGSVILDGVDITALDEDSLARLNAHYQRSFTFDDLWAEVWRRVYAFRQRSSRVPQNYLSPDEARLVFAQDTGFGSWDALAAAVGAGGRRVPSYAIDVTDNKIAPRRTLSGDEWDDLSLEYTHPQTGRALLPTMACWVQMIRPGKRLKAHRHTGSAVYYVVQGSGETVIDGSRFVWERGDIIVLPSWALHEHANRSSRDAAILFSIQDRPVLEALGLYREEPYFDNGGHQPVMPAA